LSGILFSSPLYAGYSGALAGVVFALNVIIVVAYIVSYLAVVLAPRVQFSKFSNAKLRKVSSFLLSFLENEKDGLVKVQSSIVNIELTSAENGEILTQSGAPFLAQSGELTQSSSSNSLQKTSSYSKSAIEEEPK